MCMFHISHRLIVIAHKSMRVTMLHIATKEGATTLEKVCDMPDRACRNSRRK